MSAPERPSWVGRLRDGVLERLGMASRAQVRDLRERVGRHAGRTAESLDHVIRRLDRLERQIEALAARAVRIESALRRGRLRKVDHNVDALVRHAFLGWTLPYPQALLARRFQGLSQNEEDGITVALLERIGVTTRRFVEIGAGVNGGNGGFLARECGWTGVMFEIDPERARTLERRFGSGVTVVQGRVTRENVDRLLTEHGATGEVDLLSIDVDGIDYWIWERMSACRPRLVIAEFNPAFGFTRRVTVPYDAGFDRRAFPVAGYHGASLPALVRLAADKGYRLVVVDPRGVNAFFVREDVAGDLPVLPAARPPLALEGIDRTEPDVLFAALRDAALPLVEMDD